jgi:hypothetical protein
MNSRYMVLVGLLFIGVNASAGDDKVEAAIGGGVGGAVGAVIGQELGDKEGAIIGAGVGAAVGAAIAIDEDEGGDGKPSQHDVVVEVVEVDHPHGSHCPPGQAKKNRC